MRPNILHALTAMMNLPNRRVELSAKKSKNEMNAQGVTLEEYIKDLFCNSVDLPPDERDARWTEAFSYQGTQNNPPDFMIRGGDAVEVKKRESKSARIPLNSSPPKHKLLSGDPRVNEACRTCEEWTQRDIIYVCGHVRNKPTTTIESLWFVYGDVYAAPHEAYDRFAEEIRKVLEHGLAYGEAQRTDTNELGGVRGLDPRRRANLRIRGMWDIEGPDKVFKHLVEPREASFRAHAILKAEKYNSFPKEDREMFEAKVNEIGARGALTSVEVPDPSGSTIPIKAKLFSFWE